jgi:type IV secretory pathway VirB4 component
VTTAHLGAAYPFIAETGLGSRGVYVGQDLLGGGFFCFDPWDVYARGLVSGPNLCVFGRVGAGKSSFVKSYVYRQLVFGRRAWMIDPKGENGPLCSAVGVEPVRLRPGGDVCLNPLDVGPGERPGGDRFREQLAMLDAVLGTTLRRDTTPPERAACELALRAAVADGRAPTLPGVVRALLRPSRESARSLATDVETLARDGRHVALELRRLCEGDLQGMFDGPTSARIELGAPLVSLDLSAVYHSRPDALGTIMVCATAWLQRELLRRDGTKRMLVIDEAWVVLRELSIARWLHASWKLARELGVQGVMVAHRASDLSAAGSGRSEQVRLARGLLSDSETRVVYGQPANELELAREVFQLTPAETELVGRLGRGVALWKVGQRSFLVQHRLARAELSIVDTDAQMAVSRPTDLARPGGGGAKRRRGPG